MPGVFYHSVIHGLGKTIKHDFSVFYLTNREASTVLCSFVKRAGSGRAQKKCRGKHET